MQALLPRDAAAAAVLVAALSMVRVSEPVTKISEDTLMAEPVVKPNEDS